MIRQGYIYLVANNRVQIFILDDSYSRGQLLQTRLCATLSFLLAQDGIENIHLYTATWLPVLPRYQSMELIGFAVKTSSARRCDLADMEDHVELLLEDYLENIDELVNQRPRHMQPVRMRPISLYILTDDIQRGVVLQTSMECLLRDFEELRFPRPRTHIESVRASS